MALKISFNTIADAYDHQRAHPPAVSQAIGEGLVRLAGPGAHVLELGVGTGRIAIPTALAGGRVTGVDIAEGMLRVAAARGDELRVPIALARADIARLPFASQSFDAAMAVHVLHLIPDWRGALGEIARVLRPGAALIQGNDWRDPASCVGRLRSQFRQVLVELLPGARPPGAGAAVAQHLGRLGATVAEPVALATWVTPVSPAAVLAGMAARADAETWVLPDDLLEAAMERLRAWAAGQWPDLEVPEPVEHRFNVAVARFP